MVRVKSFLKLAAAVLTDVFASENGYAVRASAEDAGGLVFFEHHHIVININLKRVFFFNTEGSSKFDRKGDEGNESAYRRLQGLFRGLVAAQYSRAPGALVRSVLLRFLRDLREISHFKA